MKFRLLAITTIGVLCFLAPMHIQAAEIETEENVIEEMEDIQERAAGLITSYSLACSNASRTLYITAKTKASEVMAKVGFTNIVVQRSSDKSNWTTEVTLGDKIKEDASFYSLNNISVSVKGGYYYRVKCTHYAKEDAFFFPSTQSVENISSYVWIP